MNRQAISLLLALALCVSLLTGCGSDGTNSNPHTEVYQSSNSGSSSSESSEAESTEAASDTAETDPQYAKYQAAYAKYSPDTVVMRVNGAEITWDAFFYWLYDIAVQLEYYYEISSWSDQLEELVGYMDDPTFGNYAKTYAATNCIQMAVIEAQAISLGAGLTEAQYAELETNIASYADSMGGQEEFNAYLAETFLSYDYFRKQGMVSEMYENLFEMTYGKDAENYPADKAIQYLKDAGYMHAKHILFKTVDDSYAALDEETIAAQRALAEEVLSQLSGLTGAALEAKFDELMVQYSEDQGSISYPDGYYFTTGEMVAAFEDAAKALGEYEISGIVESDYGFHIIFCPAMSADAVIGYDSNYQPYTAKLMAASTEFNDVVNNWYNSAVVEFEPEFLNFDMDALLAE